MLSILLFSPFITDFNYLLSARECMSEEQSNELERSRIWLSYEILVFDQAKFILQNKRRKIGYPVILSTIAILGIDTTT